MGCDILDTFNGPLFGPHSDLKREDLPGFCPGMITGPNMGGGMGWSGRGVNWTPALLIHALYLTGCTSFIRDYFHS